MRQAFELARITDSSAEMEEVLEFMMEAVGPILPGSENPQRQVTWSML